MENFLVIINMFVAALCLYQAGKFGAAMEYDRDVFKEKTPTHIHILYWLDIFFGLYLIISVYGQGIERGGM